MVKSNLKLSKNFIKQDQLVKNMVDPPMALIITKWDKRKVFEDYLIKHFLNTVVKKWTKFLSL